MAGRNTAVFGIYPTRTSVDSAVDALKAAEFRNQDISVLFPENTGTKDFAHEKNTKAPEGASTGAGTGAVLGGSLGWLAGIGALAIPGLGPFIAAGPIMAALAGAGVGGVVGGLTGALVGMGIPEYEAKRYEGRVKDGGILLSVHSDDSEWTKKAKEILERTGAQDISSTGEASSDKGDQTRVREVA
jgi:ActD protein